MFRNPLPPNGIQPMDAGRGPFTEDPGGIARKGFHHEESLPPPDFASPGNTVYWRFTRLIFH